MNGPSRPHEGRATGSRHPSSAQCALQAALEAAEEAPDLLGGVDVATGLTDQPDTEVLPARGPGMPAVLDAKVLDGCPLTARPGRVDDRCFVAGTIDRSPREAIRFAAVAAIPECQGILRRQHAIPGQGCSRGRIGLGG